MNKNFKIEYMIEYINESGEPSISKIFAYDEAEVRQIFQRIYGAAYIIKSVIKCEIKPVIVPLMEFE